MKIRTKRVYEPRGKGDGYRVLVDRLWPRGLSKDDADLDRWDKDVAPSPALRKRYHSDQGDWGEFRKAYLKELRENAAASAALLDAARGSRKRNLTLLYASRDESQNHAMVLRDHLQKLQE